MIRTFQVRLNAAHPELPLFEASAIVGSASTAFIRGVPRAVGSWHITKVYVSADYPDGSNVVVEAAVGAEGVYTATLPATQYSGRTKCGFQVLADGIDENGDPVTGYLLGIADFAVYTRELVVVPGPSGYAMRFFDTAPDTAKKGDVATVDGALQMYDGSAWIAFADLANYYTKAETDAAIEAVAAYYITYNSAGAAFPTRADLINAETYYSGGAARVPTRNDYAVVLADENHSGGEWRYIYAVADGETVGEWEAQYPIETNDYSQLSNKPTINNVELSGNKSASDLGLASTAAATLTERTGFSEWDVSPASITYEGQTYQADYYAPQWGDPYGGPYTWYYVGQYGDPMPLYNSDPGAVSFSYMFGDQTVTATRTALSGYQLGNQSYKPLASEAEAEALRTAVLGKASSVSVDNTTLTPDANGNVALPVTNSASSSSGNVLASAKAVKTVNDKVTDLTTNLADNYYTKTQTDGAIEAEAEALRTLVAGGLTTSNLTVGVRYAGSTIGTNSVAAGGENEASGNYSFANGANTKAKGSFSHAEGVNTEATGGYQHAEGSWNDPHTVLSGTAEQIAAGTALWMLGFGTSSSAKKNALETMRNGKTFVYGVGGFDGTNPTGSGVVDLAAFLNALPSAGDLRYALGTAVTTGTAQLADRTINAVTLEAASAAAITATFPAAVTGYARDFLILVSKAADATGSITITAPSGATIYGDGLSTAIAAGETWLVSVTEIAANVFWTKANKMEVAV